MPALQEGRIGREVLGRYHVVERLAVGGMAEIFLARERGAHGLERLVVVKQILPSLAEDPDFMEMFLREARVAARITHPNVVQILELGEADGLPYIAMEYVPGSTMRQLLQAAGSSERGLPVEVALDLAMQACAGAHAVHELADPQGRPYGLVHRDLTPHNLMVTDEGFVKLLDFGIVKATIHGDDRTRTGVLKGKIAYMSPEQCRQEDLDRRSDIFALGNVAWELLAGEKLFQAPNELGVMQAIITGNVRDLRQVRPDVPDPVVNALERALAPARDSRYDDAAQMRRALALGAEASDLRVDREVTATHVRRLLGPKHEERRRAVEQALERTVVTGGSSSGSTSLTGVTNVTQVGLFGVFGALGLGAAGLTIMLIGLVVVVVVALFYGRDQVGDTYVPPGGTPITMALAPIVDPDVLMAELEPLRRYLEQSIDRPLELRMGGSYEGTARLVIEGEVPYAMLPPTILIKTVDANPGELELLATKKYDDSSGFEGVLLVREDTEATRVEEMEGGTVCYSDRDSTTGYVFPRAWIRRAGLDPDTDFQARYSGNHTQVLLDLLEGRCHLGGTYMGNYTAAHSQGIPVAQLQTLAITGRSPHDAMVAGPGADDATTSRLRQALLAFDPVVHLGRDRVGDVENITGFEPVDIGAFERLRKAIEMAAPTEQ